MAQQKKPYECFACKNNGFPNEMILLAGRDDRGNPIRKNLDESHHEHKTKLAPKRPAQQQQTTVPSMNQYTNSNKWQTPKDEQISQYHAENREDREAYRQLMREEIDSRLEIARAINKLAEAIKESKTGGFPV